MLTSSTISVTQMLLWILAFSISHCGRSAFTIFPQTYVTFDRFYLCATWASNHIIKIGLKAIWGFHLISLTLTSVSHATLLCLIKYFTEIQGDDLLLVRHTKLSLHQLTQLRTIIQLQTAKRYIMGLGHRPEWTYPGWLVCS